VLCRSTVVLQRTEHGVDVVQIAPAIEIAGCIAAEIVTMGRYGTTRKNRAVAARIVCDNAVLENHVTILAINRDRAADRAITETDSSGVINGEPADATADRAVTDARRSAVEEVAAQPVEAKRSERRGLLPPSSQGLRPGAEAGAEGDAVTRHRVEDSEEMELEMSCAALLLVKQL